MQWALAMLGLSLPLALAGCTAPDVPNAGDDEVEVIVWNPGLEPHWYDVVVLRGATVVLQGNVTAGREPTPIDGNPDDHQMGRREVGDVPPGRYEVRVRSSGGPDVARQVEVTTRHYVSIQQETGRIRIHLAELGE